MPRNDRAIFGISPAMQRLEGLVQRAGEGGFRADLRYRINTVPLHIPPLRERAEDLLWLARRFLDGCPWCFSGWCRLGRHLFGDLPLRRVLIEVKTILR